MTPQTPMARQTARAAIGPRPTARERRHFMLQRLIERHRSGSGSAPVFLRQRTAMHAWPDLRPLLEGIPWAIVGGVATRAYMPERFTRDLDVLVRVPDGPAALRRLEQAGFTVVTRLAIPGVALMAPDGHEVDLLFGDQAWLDEALSAPSLDAAGYPVLGLPYLVLLKLQSARAQDWADASRMLGQADERLLDDVRAVVARYSPEDAEDLESLIFLGRSELS